MRQRFIGSKFDFGASMSCSRQVAIHQNLNIKIRPSSTSVSKFIKTKPIKICKITS